MDNVVVRPAVVQVGGSIAVTTRIADALRGRATMTMLDLDRWPWWLPGAQALAAESVATDVRNWRPPFDVAHYHDEAVRAALIGLAGFGPQPPWILHVHTLTPYVRRAMKRAPVVIYSDPSLDIDGVFLPLDAPDLGDRLLEVYRCNPRIDHSKFVESTKFP